MAADRPIFTIGHSTRPLGEFVDILRTGKVELVVDVRTVPRSRHNPQYNEELLPDALAGYQLGYRRIADLGGLRGRSSAIAPEVNGYWQNQSFHNYADYALSGRFAEGLDQLIGLALERRCAIMCAEAVWWRCHRRIIADYLLAEGLCVFHLMSPDRIETASLTPAARLKGGRLTYPVAHSA